MVAKATDTRVTLRVPPALYERLRAQAKRNRRSINSEVLTMIERGLGPLSPKDK